MSTKAPPGTEHLDQDDKNTISDKIFDFSQESVSRLIKDGIHGTLNIIYQEENDKGLFKEWLSRFIKEIDKDLLEPILKFKEKERL
ncbi:MAG: hypothetical protein ACPKPY_07775 [Nitrososphaeraceae archaeon]